MLPFKTVTDHLVKYHNKVRIYYTQYKIRVKCDKMALISIIEKYNKGHK